MTAKRPYNHILKNLFHEQATEIIPLLMPGFQVLQVIDVELPELRTTEIPRPVSDLERGVAKLALPDIEVLSVMQTEWIEHSGKFERAYRVHNPETNKPSYLLFEFQIEREDEELPRRLLAHYATVNSYAAKDVRQEDNAAEDEESILHQEYYVYPEVLCPFPHAVPAHIKEMFNGQVMLEFNFRTLRLWEKDAREFLNTHISATYFLLPAMKNADASLLSLVIEELAQQFQSNEMELARHLTGLSLMLQQSELMSDDQKLLAQNHLKPYTHLIKNDPHDE
ncbi:MAG TPA: hypothetical protein VGU68_01495 [Ktedonobacteraceae bacterium]|nr:hypothetical protein [Ktedonobacteraceae bacterium]